MRGVGLRAGRLPQRQPGWWSTGVPGLAPIDRSRTRDTYYGRMTKWLYDEGRAAEEVAELAIACLAS
jgi:hypothetical protein